MQTSNWTEAQFKAEAARQGYDPAKVSVKQKLSINAQLLLKQQGKVDGDDGWHVGASTDLRTRTIDIYPFGIPAGMEAPSLAHEIMHCCFDAVLEQIRTRTGPFYERMAPLLDANELFSNFESGTPYIREVVNQFLAGTPEVNILVLVHETLAEMATVEESTGILHGKPIWQKLYHEIRAIARELGVLKAVEPLPRAA